MVLFEPYYKRSYHDPSYIGHGHTYYYPYYQHEVYRTAPDPTQLIYTDKDFEQFKKKYPEKAKEIEAKAKAVADEYKKTIADLEKKAEEQERIKKLTDDFERLFAEDRDELRKLCRKYFGEETTVSEASEASEASKASKENSKKWAERYDG